MSIFASSKKNPAATSGSAGPATPTGTTPEESRSRQEPAAGSRSASGDRLRATRERATSASTLNPHLTFEGELKYTGKVSIDCEFHGRIVTEDTLIVGPSACIHAEVTAGVVEISGKIHGDIKALKSVKILSGGEVHGNIETPTIAMEEGVLFEGSCSRPADAPTPAPEKVTRPAPRPAPQASPTLGAPSAPAPRNVP